MMKLSISQTSEEMGRKAAERVAELIAEAVAERGKPESWYPPDSPSSSFSRR